MISDSPRTVWITGASSGIGLALAENFASYGDIVIASARSREKLEDLQQRIRITKGRCEIVECDVQDSKSVAKAFESIEHTTAAIDILINNAGISSFKDFSSTDIDDFDQVISTNLRGSFLTTKAVLPGMLAHQKGMIINILSFVTKEVFPQSAAYTASKAGVEGMMNVLRSEVRRRGINIVNVYPGAVRTPIWHPKVQEKYQTQMLETHQVASMIYDISVQPSSLAVEEIVLRPQGGNLQL